MRVLLIGAGMMAKEYCKILCALNHQPVVIGRSQEKADIFEKETKVPVLSGGCEKNISKIKDLPNYAIVATNMDCLSRVTNILLNQNIKNILIEKPAGMNQKEIEETVALVKEKKANVFVAYNRRFYTSTEKALNIIKEDGGVTSFFFEFTEWGHIAEKSPLSKEIKENWFLGNSIHVVDLAFFLGGFPKELSSYTQGSLPWHKRGCIYAGAGLSDKGALFSYQANWDAPGRWAVEILTKNHRLYFKPIEKLQIQEKASLAVNYIEIDDRLDLDYKPGLYRQVESFLNNIDDGKKLTIEEHLNHMQWYEKIEGTK